MECFIRIENGQPFEHPILKDNFCAAFPDVDTNNLPPEFARFERIDRPRLGQDEIIESQTSDYELIDGVWKDVWRTRKLTMEEIEAKKQIQIKEAQDAWATRPQVENWSAWIFNEDTLKYEPPIMRPAPDQAKLDMSIYTVWCGADNNWKDTPARPVDGTQYAFDFLDWQWVQVVD